jgi:hypothetical protein
VPDDRRKPPDRPCARRQRGPTAKTEARIEFVIAELERSVRPAAVVRAVARKYAISYRAAREVVRKGWEEIRDRSRDAKPFSFERMEMVKLSQLEEAEEIRRLAVDAALGKDAPPPGGDPAVVYPPKPEDEPGYVDPEIKARMLGVAVRAVAVKGHISTQLARLHGLGYPTKEAPTPEASRIPYPPGIMTDEQALARLEELRAHDRAPRAVATTAMTVEPQDTDADATPATPTDATHDAFAGRSSVGRSVTRRAFRGRAFRGRNYIRQTTSTEGAR